ncbi:retrovirus-related Pol polyprotein from transposon 17.6 [Trichonephila clavipes]|nr:retrovirus-related Pol polyprotein from transposon 17.6 [Trichonephila clavipes]
MEEKQNCIQTPVNKGTAQFCYKKQKMESYIPFTTCRKKDNSRRKHFRRLCKKKKELITRIARWALQLEEFDYEIEHRAGSRMKHVDALSRYPIMMLIRKTGQKGRVFESHFYESISLSTYHVDFIGPYLHKQKLPTHFHRSVNAFLPNLLGYIPSKLCPLKVLEKLKTTADLGNPIRIISDRGSAFTSKLFNDYCDEENIQHLQNSDRCSSEETDKLNEFIEL